MLYTTTTRTPDIYNIYAYTHIYDEYCIGRKYILISLLSRSGVLLLRYCLFSESEILVEAVEVFGLVAVDVQGVVANEILLELIKCKPSKYYLQ